MLANCLPGMRVRWAGPVSGCVLSFLMFWLRVKLAAHAVLTIDCLRFLCALPPRPFPLALPHQGQRPRRGGFSWEELHRLSQETPWSSWVNAVLDQHDKGELLGGSVHAQTKADRWGQGCRPSPKLPPLPSGHPLCPLIPPHRLPPPAYPPPPPHLPQAHVNGCSAVRVEPLPLPHCLPPPPLAPPLLPGACRWMRCGSSRARSCPPCRTAPASSLMTRWGPRETGRDGAGQGRAGQGGADVRAGKCGMSGTIP